MKKNLLPWTLLGLFVVADGAYGFVPVFDTRIDYQVKGLPCHAAALDLNGDGHADLVNANAWGDDVSVLLGQGNGTFSDAVYYEVGEEPYNMIVGDFNNDGRGDVVTSNYQSDTVSVLISRGDGTFWPAIHTEFGVWGWAPSTLKADDFNGDGHLDLVVGLGGWSKNVALLLGIGGGYFWPAQLYLAGDGTASMEVGDLNHDDHQDLVVTGTPDRWNVTVLLGSGTGTLLDPVSYAVDGFARSVRVEFLDGDEHPDIVVANGSSDNISVLLGNGDGTFQEEQTADVGEEPRSLATDDFNGDGNMDVAVANYYSDDVSVLLGNGDGTFTPAVPYPMQPYPRYILSRDVDGDGHQDLIVTQEYSDRVSVLPGNGDGTFGTAVHYVTAGGPGRPVLEDLNGDGYTDLAVANNLGGTVSVLLGKDGGAFRVPERVDTSGARPTHVVVGDLDGDGENDMASVYTEAGTVVRMLGNGDGTFQDPVLLDAGVNPTSLALWDFNGDDKLDLAVTNAVVPTTESSTVSVLPGNGDGSFQSPAAYAVGTTTLWISVLDVNLDGIRDLVVANHDSDDVTVLRGLPDGTFYDSATIAGCPGAFRLAVEDLNGDGLPDLAVANQGRESDLDRPPSVSVLINNAAGSFSAPVHYLEGTTPSSVALADVNRDGIPDLVVPTWTGCSILPGNGDGTFQAPEENSYCAADVVAGDFNIDGRNDLALSCSGGNRVDLYFGGVDGSLQESKHYYGAGESAGFITAGDIDGNGGPDLVVAGASDISVLLNRLTGSLCQDDDGDGYGDPGSPECGYPELDCDDSNPDVNPGMTEIPGNGLDDDCDPTTPAYPEPANTIAASYGRSSLIGSGLFNGLTLLLVPMGAVVFLKIRSRKR